MLPSRRALLTPVFIIVSPENRIIPGPILSDTGPTIKDVVGIVVFITPINGFVAHIIHHVPVPLFVGKVDDGKVVTVIKIPPAGCVNPTPE